MQGLILAAGRGSRLGERSSGTAKALLEVGRKALIDHAIDALAGCGVGPLGLVVGYAAPEVEEHVGIRAEYVHNTRWAATNSLYSFWLARDWVKGDVFVLNCDVLFSPRIIERLLDTPGDAIAYDSSSGERREEMSVQVVDGRLMDMSKTLPQEKVCGENVGILKLTHDTARTLFAKADELIAQGREKEWLGSAVREIAQTRPIKAVDIHGLPWSEIDFPADLDRARKVTWPAIAREQRRARMPWKIARWAAGAVLGIALVAATYRAWISPVETSWEPLPPEGVPSVVVTNGAVSRDVSLLQPGQAAMVRTAGPTTLRIDARPLCQGPDAGEVHFVLVVSVDGKEVGWHSLASRPSQTWRLGEQCLGKRFRLEVDVLAGDHVVTTQLATSDGGGCVVRMSRLLEEL